ncbi:hypothetical protein CVT26_016170 [Gymnopilus dilepis]|uniref:Uncharacterized protein n=1 Tax=Gymnopilus dilepis TaxID=231916 RepID=A0A409XZ05_9AGAR|nr:hypothetical protein CVT26_016170 [Gymnopilus dilepis]
MGPLSVDILHRFLQLLPSQDVILKHLRNVPTWAYVAGGIIGWMGLVRALRWRRYNAIHREFGPKWDNGRGSITPEEAQKIILQPILYDMPLLLNYALAFALFKTYAVPSISKLLCATTQLKSKDTISRRYADTELLISTFVGCPLSGFLDPSFHLTNTGPEQKPAEDPRGALALARTNYLHSKHRISNGDFLYTLALFVLEPNTWANRYGWRKLSPLERHAFYVFWLEIGKRMDIKDIPENFEALQEWSQVSPSIAVNHDEDREYERAYMVPEDSNHELADNTLDELLSAVPEAFGLKAFAKRVSIALLDNIVREAMIYPEQPWLLKKSAQGLLIGINLFQRFFMLPRGKDSWFFPIDIRLPQIDEKASCPRLYPRKWAARPWYRPEPTTTMGYLRDKFLVAINFYTEMPGPHLKSSGYRIEEMGPTHWEDCGHEEVTFEAAKLLGCPVTGPWSIEGRKGTT